MAGRADATFAQRAQAASSPLDALVEGLSGTPLDAARREVARETLDELAHRLFISAGKPPLQLGQAEQELVDKRRRMDKLVPNLRDGGAGQWKMVARFELYIKLLKEKEQQHQLMAAEKERQRQKRQQLLLQQQQEQQQAPPPEQHPQQQDQSKVWLQQVRGLGAARACAPLAACPASWPMDKCACGCCSCHAILPPVCRLCTTQRRRSRS